MLKTVTIRNTSNDMSALADVLIESERSMKVSPQGTTITIMLHKRADGVFRGETAGIEFELVK